MKNIKFIDRKEELEKIKKTKKKNFFLVLKGRRRIGKTMLLKKALPNSVYIFIWPNKSMEWITEQICKEHGLPSFRTFGDILTYLLDQKKTIVIDEFQNLLNVDKSVYGEIQKIIDERKMEDKFMKIAVAGSSYSLMNKVFNDIASPLYGRRTSEITLRHLPVKDLFIELKIPLENFIKLWSVFEGVPYYYELINPECSAEKNITDLIISKDAKLQEEGKVVLSVEFGKDSKTYNTVMAAIAEGKMKLNEIASLFDNKTGEVIKYLSILRKDFRLVRKTTPILDDPRKSKQGRYEIIDNFLSFWFYFVDRLRNYIEQERFDEMERFFEANFDAFVAKKFEKLITMLVREKIIFGDSQFTKAGKQWGKIKNKPKGENAYEMDILALDERKKEILFCECKWKSRVNAESIARELNEKTKHVDWHLGRRTESFAIFAKSFSRRLKDFDGKKVYCFDLKDLERILRK